MAWNLDDRWEWIEVTNFGQLEPQYVRGRCLHRDVVDVESVDGQIVAQLCLTCDAELLMPEMTRKE